MNVIRGDLIQLALQGAFDVIVHGCNCQCAMGAGIAKAIAGAFPAALAADRATVRGDRGKLGTISTARVAVDGRDLTVVNAYSQFHYRGPKPHVDYDAVRSAFGAIRANFSGARIGYPLIGAGLAGGDWNVIASILEEELEGEHHTLVEFARVGRIRVGPDPPRPVPDTGSP